MRPTLDEIKWFALMMDLVNSARYQPDPSTDTGTIPEELSANSMVLVEEFNHAAPPPTPEAGLRIYAERDVGRAGFGIIGPRGVPTRPQPHMAMGSIYYAAPVEGTATISGFGFSSQTTGTVSASAIAPANTALLGRTRRVHLTSATTAGSAAGWRHDHTSFFRGQSVKQGGFYIVLRWGIHSMTTTPSDSRIMAGLDAYSGAFGNGDFTNATNTFFFGCNVGETNIQVYHNDAAGTPTKVDTGLPRPVVNDVFETKYFCEPGGAIIQCSIENMRTGTRFEYSSGTTGNIPAATQDLALHINAANGAATQAVGIAFMSAYAEVAGL